MPLFELFQVWWSKNSKTHVLIEDIVVSIKSNLCSLFEDLWYTEQILTSFTTYKTEQIFFCQFIRQDLLSLMFIFQLIHCFEQFFHQIHQLETVLPWNFLIVPIFDYAMHFNYWIIFNHLNFCLIYIYGGKRGMIFFVIYIVYIYTL